MCPTERELSILPLPLGEAGRRPGVGAFRSGTLDESTLTPALSQRERENENRQQRCKIRAAELVPNSIAIPGPCDLGELPAWKPPGGSRRTGGTS